MHKTSGVSLFSQGRHVPGGLQSTALAQANGNPSVGGAETRGRSALAGKAGGPLWAWPGRRAIVRQTM